MTDIDVWVGSFQTIVPYQTGLVKVGIARGHPKWMSQVPQYLPLAPSGRLLAMWPKGQASRISEGEWTRRYAAELDELDPLKVIADLARLMEGVRTDGRGVVLCCYEKHRPECHRDTAGLWLEEHTGIPVDEFRPALVDQPEQGRLPEIWST